MSKESSIEKKAREKFVNDWGKRTVNYLVIGTVDPRSPALSKHGKFYVQSISCEGSDEDAMFCSVYNNLVEQKIAEEGVPEWAPCRRRPTQLELLELLCSKGEVYDAYKHESIKERNLTASVLYGWRGVEPKIWVRLQDRGLLIFGGDISHKEARIDVIDTNEMRWLSSERLSRKRYSDLPWD